MTSTAAPVPMQCPSTDVDKAQAPHTAFYCLSEALKSHFLLMLSEPRHPKSTNFYTVYASVYSVYGSTQTTPEHWNAAWVFQETVYAAASALCGF